MSETDARCSTRERASAGARQRVGTQLVSARIDELPDPCTSAQLAAALGKSPKTIVDWCQERRYTQLPCFRLGNRWYHSAAELKRWLKGIKSGQIEFRRRPRDSAERS